MPDPPHEKVQVHPFRLRRGSSESRRGRLRAPVKAVYAELATMSNFTFLTGASHPEEMVQQAAALGHAAAALADCNTLAGVVRAHVAAKEIGMPLAVGCRLDLADPPGLSVLVYPTDRPSYARLCRLLTLGKRRAPKGECHLSLDDLIEYSVGMLAVAIPPRTIDEEFAHALRRLADVFDDDRLSLAARRAYEADDEAHLRDVARLADETRVPLAAVNDARYHRPERRALQDVMTCIRHGCTIEEAGLRLAPNAERHLKPSSEMARLFADRPGALLRSAEAASRAADFSLDELKYEYPVEPCPPGMTALSYLIERTNAGAAKRYPEGVPEKVRDQLAHEIDLIRELKYEAYFLTCYDIVSFARSRGILCQGRGGAANSAVCYCLGITEVDPAKFSLLFERFVSRERNEPPDIDIDFEHERREEVIQYLYKRYGRDRAALTAEVITYRGRSAVREVGKAMGLSLDCVDALAKNLDRWTEPLSDGRAREMGLNPNDPTIRRVIELTSQLVGFPRHLSQHVGGFVITRSALSDLVPIENAAMEDRTVIEWDKDDIDAMGMLKVDCLGLGMLTCVRKAFALVERHSGTPLTIADVMAKERPDDDVYEMIQRADTVGVFQIESRAQMSMLPRLKPREFYDLVIEVAIVRPGPIQGGMVHPYLRRREGKEPVEFPEAEVKEVLGRTLGVPLFQEQAMQLAITAAGFTPDEADGLRRAMAAWRRKGDKITLFGQRLIDGMVARGYPSEFAERCFEQIRGFSEYGFPESHAASFAILVYVSCWLKKRHPAAFAAALINSQPMGFYQPAQIIRDAREHGVEVREVDVNRSGWDCGLEGSEASRQRGIKGEEVGEEKRKRDEAAEWDSAGGPAVRLGMRLVKGMRKQNAERIAHAVGRRGAFRSVERLWRESGASAAGLRALAKADAFGSMGLDRRAAMWQIRPLRDTSLPLFEQNGENGAHKEGDCDAESGSGALPAAPLSRQVLQDYEATGLSLKAHPISLIRRDLDDMGVMQTSGLRAEKECPQGTRVAVAGLVLGRQRPSTASGVVFITLEDETGIANLVVWRDVFERCRKAARLSTVLLCRGTVERQGEVAHVHAGELVSLNEMAPRILFRSRDFH